MNHAPSRDETRNLLLKQIAEELPYLTQKIYPPLNVSYPNKWEPRLVFGAKKGPCEIYIRGDMVHINIWHYTAGCIDLKTCGDPVEAIDKFVKEKGYV